MDIEQVSILNVKVSAVNLPDACEVIEQWIVRRIRTYVCVVPVSTIVACQQDKDYMAVVNGAGMATPDGMPVVWLAKLKKGRQVDRTYGPDLMLALCEAGEEKGYRHYFYGGTSLSLDLLERELKKRFAKIKITGKYAPPFRPLNRDEEAHLTQDIKRAQPDILWVGIGSPQQDFWMKEHRDKLQVPVMIGVGAAFDFLSGVKKQAPRWMQRAGLEWFYRLYREPQRLWKRYLVGNTKFLYFLLKAHLLEFFKRT